MNLKQTELPSQSLDGLAGKWWVLVAIGVGTFMSALDGSVVNTTLPVITRSFTSSIAAVEWVMTIYLLVISGLLTDLWPAGRPAGPQTGYIAGFVIFVASSALCGLAPSVDALIAFRAFRRWAQPCSWQIRRLS